jgi:hypothetical protein
MAQGSLKRWGAAALALVIAGCTAPPAPAPPPVAVEAAPPPAPTPPPPPPPKDSCGAAALQYLVGHPRTDIPVPVNPNLRRVACSTCAVTQDYVAARQTIVYDSQTGLVQSVKCG